MNVFNSNGAAGGAAVVMGILLEGTNCRVEGNEASNNEFPGKAGVGIYLSNFASGCLIRGNTVMGNRTDSTAPRTGAGIELPFFAGINNTLTNNRIFDNDGLGIDLAEPGSCVEIEPGAGCPGVTVNDVGDGDSGPNNFQNFPVLTEAEFDDDELEVEGSLNSEANKTYLIQLFSSSKFDASGHGEGEAFVADFKVTTDAYGDVEFEFEMGGLTLAAGHKWMTATATELDDANTLSTSEFSAAVAIDREDDDGEDDDD